MSARILDCTPDEYHRLPGFSSTLAKVLLAKSAAHARDMHDRKLEAEGDDEEELTDQQRAKLERGSVLHTLILGKGKRIKVLPYDKYSTKVARDDRDAARAAGLIPVNQAKMEMFERTAIAIRARLVAMGHELTGTSELAIEWTEDTEYGPVPCRSMMDHVIVDAAVTHAVIYDIKIVDDASPSVAERSAERMHYAMQAACYRRALDALYPSLAGRIDFHFLFCEPHRPYEIWAPSPDGAFRTIGERRWMRAATEWARGLRTNEWRGYHGVNIDRITPPPWALRKEGMPTDE